jgi:L-ascorbate metabolism protein UlaG (beta-lactamase superfamily)
MKLTWFGHSAFRLETGASVVLIDPFLSGNPTFEAAGLDAEQISADATHVVLSHGHDDHVGDAVKICNTTGARLVTVYELALYLNAQGVENIDPANPGGTVDQGDFDVSFVQANHSSSTMVDGKPVYLGAACGLVFRMGDGEVLYHMGDTDIFRDMGLINEIFEPKVGLVPVGDRFTMGARTAALACQKYFEFETVLPMHYGTFPIIDATPDKFIAQAEGQNVLAPKPGENLEF